jgi:hypothetical protein
VDYLDKILADPEAAKVYVIDDIVRLRRVVKKVFNGKTAKELGY